MSKNDLGDPEVRANVQKQLRKLQRMIVALQKIIEIDADATAVSMWARKALDDKEF